VNRELDEELRVFRERYESTLNMDQVSRSIYFVTNENDEQERSNFEVSKASSSFSKAREEHSFSGADVLQSDEHLSLKEVCRFSYSKGIL
jgi:hypothetical protein